jgi:hypothetical protein
MEDAVMLTKQACIDVQFLRRSTLAAIGLPFQGSDTISKSSNILRQLQGLTPLVGVGILHPFSRICVCGIGLAFDYIRICRKSPASPFHVSCSTFPTEATMSAKKRRKIYGVRRETRRTRGWTRWFQEGFFETELANSIRLRTVLWGQK